MSDPGPLLLDVADPERRYHKSLWRQKRAIFSRAIKAALEDTPLPEPRLGLQGGPPGMASALQVELGHPVASLDQGALKGSERCHVVAMFLEELLGPAERVGRLEKALRSLRVAGTLFLLATVVQDPGRRQDRRPPRISSLLEEVAVAGGGALHTEELESIRWSGEPLVRGVALTMRYLTHQEGEG